MNDPARFLDVMAIASVIVVINTWAIAKARDMILKAIAEQKKDGKP